MGSNSSRARDFLFFKTIKSAMGFHQPCIQCVSLFLPDIKLSARVADHSAPTNADVKTEGSYNSTPSIYLRAVEQEGERKRYSFLTHSVCNW